ncbi:MAG TPA: prolyl aminopeptidase [Gammaproteobacteria bacterium]|nr:prolyl aminopeptidase [Gammaproteobacteria bacterium]
MHPAGLFPPVEPFKRGTLAVGEGHRLYFEVSGNPGGRPVLVLHGGPGSSTSPTQRRFFDPACWRIVLFDQRGCGQSAPLGSLRGNDTQSLVEDIERLRGALGVERWVLFGGSWGATLALAYTLEYPQHVSALVLRGVFLGSREEVEWFLLGLRRLLPEAWARFADAPVTDARGLLSRYHARVFDDAPASALEAARRWLAYEDAVMAAGECGATATELGDEALLARVRVQLHYLVHDCFLPARWILDGAGELSEVPAILVHGSRDLVCRPRIAHDLAGHWRGARLRIVEDGGHSPLSPGMTGALIQATREVETLGRESGS